MNVISLMQGVSRNGSGWMSRVKASYWLCSPVCFWLSWGEMPEPSNALFCHDMLPVSNRWNEVWRSFLLLRHTSLCTVPLERLDIKPVLVNCHLFLCIGRYREISLSLYIFFFLLLAWYNFFIYKGVDDTTRKQLLHFGYTYINFSTIIHVATCQQAFRCKHFSCAF